MLVTFHCKAYADITMFGEVAVNLLHMMGHSGTVPGALMPEDIPQARDALLRTLQKLEPEMTLPVSEDDPPVSLSHRALPLLSLLEAAEKENVPVMWDK